MNSALRLATVLFALVVVLTPAFTSAQQSGRPEASRPDEPSDALSAQIDTRVKEKLSEAWIGPDHSYSDRRVRKMRSQLSRVSFPAKDGTVAKTLDIADPMFFVVFRGCGISLLDDGESGRTHTREICRLNKDYELVAERLTVFRSRGNAETTEVAADIRRTKQSK